MAGLSTLFRFVSFEELKQMGIIRIVSSINNINSTITSFSLVGYKVASFMIL